MYCTDHIPYVTQEVGTKEIGTEVSCLHIGDVPHGRLACQYLSVGDWSGCVKILSLETDKLLVQLSIMDLPVK
jgi:hypothetical protein